MMAITEVEPTTVATMAIATAAVFTAIGAVSMRFITAAYHHGSHESTAQAADLQNAASIIRIEAAVQKLSETVTTHEIEDAAKFSRLETMMKAGNESMQEAAKQMRHLSDRIDRVLGGVA